MQECLTNYALQKFLGLRSIIRTAYVYIQLHFAAEIKYCGIDGECQNGGTCLTPPVPPGGHCECPAGWYGDLCECKFTTRSPTKSLPKSVQYRYILVFHDTHF